MKFSKLSLAILMGCAVLNWRPSGAVAQDDVVAAAKKKAASFFISRRISPMPTA
jgi:hypothetical protein